MGHLSKNEGDRSSEVKIMTQMFMKIFTKELEVKLGFAG